MIHGICFFNDSISTEKYKQVRSLQNHCRASILRALSTRRMQQVVKLPLPPQLIEFLMTFQVPDDFDFDGFYMEYNCNFPNHVHHRTHQLHPGVCTLDDSKVLVKLQHTTSSCALCNSVGTQAVVCDLSRDKWASLRHDHLMNCLLCMSEPDSLYQCFVMDFPELNLQDLVNRLKVVEEWVPEYLVWDIIYKLCCVLCYLQSENVSLWDLNILCQLHHVIIVESGQLKLENLLLYLPSRGGLNLQTNTFRQTPYYCKPPEESSGCISSKMLSWKLGCILRELTHSCKAVSMVGQPYSILAPMTPTLHIVPGPYSASVLSTIQECLSISAKMRPSLKNLQNVAKKHRLRLSGEYRGARNLIRLL